MNPQSLADKLKDLSLGLTTGRYDQKKVCGKLDSIAEELRKVLPSEYVPDERILEEAARVVEKHIHGPHSACRNAIATPGQTVASVLYGHDPDCLYSIAAEIRALK